MVFNVAVTAIVIAHDRALITKRSDTKSKWPGKWTVPGGKVETEDFLGTPTEINNQWYGVLENAVKREVKEEVGLDISKVEYVCSIAVPDTIIVSFKAELGNKIPEIKLQTEECTEYAWIQGPDIEKFDLIDGIGEEIRIALYG